jgi:hypothetical protein
VAAQLGAIAAGCSIIDLAIEKFARGRKFIVSARARAVCCQWPRPFTAATTS